jgi:glyoxylase-like metal-dependent hydrolase (beta-lactamase superfamily II)
MNPTATSTAISAATLVTPPTAGHATEVAQGVWWLRMPLPLALDHINLWALEDECEGVAGWTLVDAGLSTDATRAAWEQVFRDVLQGRPVLRVLCTHMHPDHVGLAAWLCERFEVPLWMTLGEYLATVVASAGLAGSSIPAWRSHYLAHGLTADMVDVVASRADFYREHVPAVPSKFVRIMDDQAIRIGRHDWRVITGYGHAPEHAALYCADKNVLISGDMLLPRISTNVSVMAGEPLGNPLGQFLRSIKRFRELPSDVLVLPSHGLPFGGQGGNPGAAHTRVADLEAHHAARLAEVLACCDDTIGKCAADIVPVMFRRKLDVHQLSFALGEALAHLHLLWHSGELARTVGDDGVVRFTRVATGATR